MMHAMSAVPFEEWIFLMAGAIKFNLYGLDSCYHTFPYVEKGNPNQRLIGDYSDLVFAYNIGTNSYQILEDRLPVGNADIRATIIGNRIYIAGGETVDPALSNTSNAFIVGTIYNNS